MTLTRATARWPDWLRQEVKVPLSEHEKKQLEQMERELHAEDPTFASRMQRVGRNVAAGRTIAIGVVGALLGLGLVLIGVSTTMWVGAVGFAVMVASVNHAISVRRRTAPRTRIHTLDR